MDGDEAALDAQREQMYRDVEKSDEESRYWSNQFRDAVEAGRDPSDVMRERIEHERRDYAARRVEPERSPETGTV